MQPLVRACVLAGALALTQGCSVQASFDNPFDEKDAPVVVGNAPQAPAPVPAPAAEQGEPPLVGSEVAAGIGIQPPAAERDENGLWGPTREAMEKYGWSLTEAHFYGQGVEGAFIAGQTMAALIGIDHESCSDGINATAADGYSPDAQRLEGYVQTVEEQMMAGCEYALQNSG